MLDPAPHPKFACSEFRGRSRSEIELGQSVLFSGRTNHDEREITLRDRRDDFAGYADCTNMAEWLVLGNQTDQFTICRAGYGNRDKSVCVRRNVETICVPLQRFEADLAGLRPAWLDHQTFKQRFCDAVPVIILIGIGPRDTCAIQAGHQSTARLAKIENEICYRFSMFHPVFLAGYLASDNCPSRIIAPALTAASGCCLLNPSWMGEGREAAPTSRHSPQLLL
jgi:hypothetical protein